MKRLVAAFLLVIPAAVPAADAPPAASDPKVCRSSAPTGSRIASVTECHRRSEWTAIDEARAQDAKRLVDGLGARAATLPQRAPSANPY